MLLPSHGPTPDKAFFGDGLTLPARITIPEMFRRHREHHGVLCAIVIDVSKETQNFKSLTVPQQEVLIHVLSRLLYASTIINRRLPEFHSTIARQKQSTIEGAEGDIRSMVAFDTRAIGSLCANYLNDVCKTPAPPAVALTPNFLKLFDRILAPQFDAYLAATKSNTANPIAAEVRLRTIYHVIAEGLGAVSAIKGMGAALQQLDSRHEQGKDQSGRYLPGLYETFQRIAFIERRNVAYGLFCLNRLGTGANYFSTTRELLSTVKEVRPVLEAMRGETFGRWSPFPFDIDRQSLQDQTAKHVQGWIKKLIIPWAGFKNVESLSDIIC